MIKKIKGIILGSKVPVSAIFDKYCSDKRNRRMSQSDFSRFTRFYHEKVADHEVDSLFRQFDQASKGFITEQEFKLAFESEIREQLFRVNIEDIVKPLATKIKHFNVNVATLFDKYDKNKNGKLSAHELARALAVDQNIRLDPDEVQIIQEYFRNKFNSLEITKSAFVELMAKDYERVYDLEQAKADI